MDSVQDTGGLTRRTLLALTGLLAGLAAAIAAGRAIQSQLFGIELLDSPTVGMVALILLTSAAAASFLPARRAARLDPGSTLRQD